MTDLPPAPRSFSSLRTILSLDGDWDFQHETDAAWRTARVPSSWQTQFPDLALSFGRATYRRRFRRPGNAEGREVALRFGAVSEFATVRVNGEEVARHEGGYLPFEAVIPPRLLREDNDVEVEAMNDESRGASVRWRPGKFLGLNDVAYAHGGRITVTPRHRG